MWNRNKDTEKNSLLNKLKWTILGLAAALLTMWFLFYVSMRNVMEQYAMQTMEQVSLQIMSDLNETFLQLEQVSFAMSEDGMAYNFVKIEDNLKFYKKAAEMELEMGSLLKETELIKNIIIFDKHERYYRFLGTINNTCISRMMYVLDKENIKKHIQISLDGVDYIGYVTVIYEGQEPIGKIVMLMDENDIHKLLQKYDKNIEIALAADQTIIVANQSSWLGQSTKDFLKTEYAIHKQVGFTPFELLISYKDTNQKMNVSFIIAVLAMVMILLVIVGIFSRFWKNKFFIPIQMVISEVEHFESGTGEKLTLTGLQHFDGLIRGINEMVERIEQKEKEIYDASYTLQESEIKKQKALIISLKKQISAHFTVNVLSIVKAFAAEGENEKAGVLCDGLSYLLRYANAGDSFISCMEEFIVLDKYVNIMKIRYPDKFVVEMEQVDYMEDIELPRMLLQPIIENSILHGFIAVDDKREGIIRLYSILESDLLKIVVEDNGCGMETESLCKLQEAIHHADHQDIEVEGLTHVALINIQRRIVSYFGKEYGIDITSTKGKGTNVTLTLPICRREI
ncbi:MAG: histidine kinase [Lachnospiraceae bacterium]|nr:histidine kinase [Lachnospiraceae bacterium]